MLRTGSMGCWRAPPGAGKEPVEPSPAGRGFGTITSHAGHTKATRIPSPRQCRNGCSWLRPNQLAVLEDPWRSELRGLAGVFSSRHLAQLHRVDSRSPAVDRLHDAVQHRTQGHPAVLVAGAQPSFGGRHRPGDPAQHRLLLSFAAVLPLYHFVKQPDTVGEVGGDLPSIAMTVPADPFWMYRAPCPGRPGAKLGDFANRVASFDEVVQAVRSLAAMGSVSLLHQARARAVAVP